MGDAAKKAMARSAPEPQKQGNGGSGDRQQGPAQKQALKKIQREAKAAGSFLTSGGKGGLDPGLVLHVMRRDKFTCKSCGELGTPENQGIGVHHVGGIVTSKRTSRMGHSNQPNNLVTICGNCHDREHDDARANGEDSSQVLPSGDRGNPRRDHGQPPAAVDR